MEREHRLVNEELGFINNGRVIEARIYIIDYVIVIIAKTEKIFHIATSGPKTQMIGTRTMDSNIKRVKIYHFCFSLIR